MTQYDLVVKHLNKHKSITVWDAYKKYGITRLSQYIYMLRKQCIKIEHEDITKKNRYGYSVTFRKYKIKSPIATTQKGLCK